jgi:hypothetical protein
VPSRLTVTNAQLRGAIHDVVSPHFLSHAPMNDARLHSRHISFILVFAYALALLRFYWF